MPPLRHPAACRRTPGHRPVAARKQMNNPGMPRRAYRFRKDRRPGTAADADPLPPRSAHPDQISELFLILLN
jgi:hypothetical protein